MNPKETYNICDSLPEVVQKNKTNVVDLYDIIGNFTGTFMMGKYYNKRDIVVYNGSQYYCIAEGFTATKSPDTDPNNWILYLAKGETGATGATGPEGPKGETGDINLYRHSIKLENSSQPYCRVWFNFYSSSNTPVDSVPNLMSVCADKGFILANGWYNKQQVIGISASTNGLQNSYIYMLGVNQDNWPGNDVPSMTPLSIVSTITDTVTTV